MPRLTEQILAHADELARRFAEHEPDSDRVKDACALRDIAAAIERRAGAEREIAAAVAVARAEGHTWVAIRAMLGTSGEAARQRYGSGAAEPAHGGRLRRSSRKAARRAREACCRLGSPGWPSAQVMSFGRLGAVPAMRSACATSVTNACAGSGMPEQPAGSPHPDADQFASRLLSVANRRSIDGPSWNPSWNPRGGS